MKSIFKLASIGLILCASAVAKELPEAPIPVANASPFVIESSRIPAPAVQAQEKPVVDKTFVALSLISTASTFSDSYTTLFARQNWLAGKKGVCNIEVQSAYLYGTHPTVGRVYAVASAKSAAAVVSAFYLRKHHSKFWSAPLVANSLISLEGVTQNMMACN